MTAPRTLTLVALAILAIPLTLAAAFFPLQTIAVLLGLIVVGVIIAWPAAGVYGLLVLFLVQSSPLYQQYAVFGQQATVADIVGLLALLSFAGHSFLRHSTDGAPRPQASGLTGIAVVTAYYVWQLLSTVWSAATSADLDLFARQAVENIALFALLVLVLNTVRRVRGAAAVYALTGIGLALYTIATFASGGGFGAAVTSSFHSSSFRGGLPSSFNVNELALITALIPGFTLIASAGRSTATRALLAGATVPVAAIALLILDSRGSFIAVTAGLLAALLLTRGRANRGAFGAIIATGGLLLIAAVTTNHVPNYVLQDPTRQFAYGNLNGRGPIWQTALTIFEQHPVIGAGADGFNTALPGYYITSADVASTHNDYLQAMADQGVIGLVLLLALLITVGYAALIGSKRSPGSIANFVICLISMSAGSFLLVKWFLPTLGVLYCTGMVSQLIPRAVRARAQTGDISALAAEVPTA